MDRFETYTLLDRIMDHFKAINDKKGLTEEDRKQIKTFYLESVITPEARKLLQKHFPEKFPAEKSASPSGTWQASQRRSKIPRPQLAALFDCAHGCPPMLCHLTSAQ